jgi:hypothetical protein
MDTRKTTDEALELANFATPTLVDALVAAAEDDEVWRKAAVDPRAFLKDGEIEVPDGIEIALEQAFLRSDPQPCRAGEVRVGRPGGRVCTRSIQLYVRRPHVQPFPTLKLCVKWEDVPWVEGGCVPISDLIERRTT